uniref:non-specific serine/threonine protein kinase n=1 Tax=Panagrolaimus superbus TaxID=310955 RepID=A0A914YVY3_9BILA
MLQFDAYFLTFSFQSLHFKISNYILPINVLLFFAGSIRCRSQRESLRRHRGSPLALQHQDSFDGHLSSGGSGSHLAPVRTIQRSHSDAVEPNLSGSGGESGRPASRSLLHEHHLNRMRKMRRRPSAVTTHSSGNNMLRPLTDSFGNHPSMDSSHRNSCSMMRMRGSALGHSDPQIYTSTVSLSPSPASRMSVVGGGSRKSVLLNGSPLMSKQPKKDQFSLSPRNRCARRSDAFLGASPSPSPNSLLAGTSSSSNHNHKHRTRASISSTSNQSRMRHPPQVAMRAGSSLAAPSHNENRRWSVASLPSSSGYVTPGSNSAFSSQYSSQEHLAEFLNDLRMNPRFDSNDSYCAYDETAIFHRPRSRSLTSPVRFNAPEGAQEAQVMASVYKERFPKAKSQMEYRLQQFLLDNSPLSGFITSLPLDLRPTSPRPSSPNPPSTKSSKQKIKHHRSHGRSSPRPTSPLPRPISPLATESATIHQSGVVFRSSFNSSGNCNLSSCNLTTPGASSLAPISPLSSQAYSCQSSTVYHSSGSNAGGSGNHRSSFACNSAAVAVTETLMQADPQLLILLADGATRFLHHQICEVAADCLQKSRDDLLTCAYFCDMSNRLEETLTEAQQKCGPDSCQYLGRLGKQLLMIVSRAARLLECLEFDPSEFYQLLEEAEGAVRYQLGSGTARVPDLPQYIVNKLGLNKNLLTDEPILSPEEEKPTIEKEIIPIVKMRQKPSSNRRESGLSSEISEKEAESEPQNTMESVLNSLTSQAPKEEDFETIRLISNGAYGAVYLVRHKKTRQRFALKKMKKQTLLLRNQVDQVYAERDILTFTDNPFVVCFYGSFETKQHLCMLMEYVEGGDCASLLKSAGTLPLELTRLYVAEAVLAIEYLHSCGITHRDLKPDNLLITALGHIKLTDFGLSKIGLMNRTTLVSEGYLDDTQQFKDNQLCGTPEYIAPEVILRQGYGKPVDFWALGIIVYEFLIGIVPFMGDSPEALFSNIINEEVEYPEGEEALDPDAENLIRQLLEKNPLDRLGNVGGASEVTSHPFFISLDFDSLLRQKAEFVPQLENDEDTSYFDSRTDRYNHDADSGDDESVPMFWSFTTASPRHSIVGAEISPANLAALNAAAQAAAAAQSVSSPSTTHPPPLMASGLPPDFVRKYGNVPSHGSQSESDGGVGTPSTTGTGSGAFSVGSISKLARLSDSTDSQYYFDGNKLPPSSGSVGARSLEGDNPSSAAVLLRRRFSSQRHTNLSTSSSGTNNTGCFNTGCSSTDSSMDASSFHYNENVPSIIRRHPANLSPLPRFAISSPSEQHSNNSTRISPTNMRLGGRVGSISGSDDCNIAPPSMCELSPVQEKGSSAFGQLSESSSRAGSALEGSLSDTHLPQISTESSTGYYRKRESNASSISAPSKPSRTTPVRSDNLRVTIPSSSGGNNSSASSSTHPSPATATTTTTTVPSSTTYYHSYGSGQLSPGGNSVSSASSFDSSNNPSTLVPGDSGQSRQTTKGSLSPIPSPNNLSTPGTSKLPLIIKRGKNGYGFTIRSVRVYLSENSEYYTIEHMVETVREQSPAYEAGLRQNDLITHVRGQPVNNMSHPELMHRLLSCGNEISLHVTALNNTSIKAGEPRRVAGKLLRKKPKKPQRRIQLEKKPRKASSLFRRLSGKHGATDVIPGTSNQKQTFIPRSVSNQDGVATGIVSPIPHHHLGPNTSIATTTSESQSNSTTASSSKILGLPNVQMRVLPKNASNTYAHKRMSDFGISPASTIRELPPIRVPEARMAKSPLALDDKSNVIPHSAPIVSGATKNEITEEKPFSPTKHSAFQELKNTIVQRFSPSSAFSSAAPATSNHPPPPHQQQLPQSSTTSTATSTTTVSMSPPTGTTGRRNSSGITISPLARQSIGSASQAIPQRPPPPQKSSEDTSTNSWQPESSPKW